MLISSVDRRHVLASLGFGAAALAYGGAPVRAAAPTKVRVGYLHVLSVDAQLWLGTHLGTWEKEGIEIEAREFTTGIELFQGLVGGGLDVLTTGGVLSNFPARGQGKVFLLNDLEYATGQIWVYPDQGIHSLKDLNGKKIATTRGTTAHDLLYQALKSVGLNVTTDVEIVNQRMSDAVTSFIAGAVPAVSLWVPFDVAVKAKAPKAKMLVSAAEFPSATIVDGWAARNGFFDNDKEVLKRFIRAWIPSNDFIINKPKEAMQILHDKYYHSLAMSEVDEMYHAARWYSSAEWAKYFTDGSATKWLNQVTQFNVDVGAMQNPIMADKYFDPSLYLEVVGGLSSK
jgi:NitT/TauT family transport system substrate-binding protein